MGSGEDSCPQGSAEATFGNLAETADHRVSEAVPDTSIPGSIPGPPHPAPPSCTGCLPREPVVRREGGVGGLQLPACPASWIQGYFFLKDMTKGDQ